MEFTHPLTEMNTTSRKECFLGVKHGRCVRLITFPPSVSQLSRQCGILNISKPCGLPWPVTGIALFLNFYSSHISWCTYKQTGDAQPQTWPEPQVCQRTALRRLAANTLGKKAFVLHTSHSIFLGSILTLPSQSFKSLVSNSFHYQNFARIPWFELQVHPTVNAIRCAVNATNSKVSLYVIFSMLCDVAILGSNTIDSDDYYEYLLERLHVLQ
jgi:hypothetical protein